MVHGVGTHVPGYGARLSANLAQALGLTVIAPEPKEFTIEALPFPGEALGELTVTCHTNAARDREMLFFELTWSPISQPAKATPSTAPRSTPTGGPSLNYIFKTFVNDVSADPLVYTGTGCEKIQAAVGQALFWAVSAYWQGQPDEQQICAPGSPNFAARVDNDEFAFITHSLGSRITVDALQRLARFIEEEAERDSWLQGGSRSFQNRQAKVFMLANQLPLLQSGLEPASVRDAVPAHCRPDGAHYADRLFGEAELIVFSDPNDLLSYPIPDRFVREHVDSRLCPRQVNVTINIAPVTSLLGVGDFATRWPRTSTTTTTSR